MGPDHGALNERRPSRRACAWESAFAGFEPTRVDDPPKGDAFGEIERGLELIEVVAGREV